MKFNKENKKWVLTLGLLVVLGFNLSVHFSPKSGPEYAQLGATQEQFETAVVAKKHTEGYADLSQQAAPPVQAVVTPEEKKEDKKKTEAGTGGTIEFITNRGDGNMSSVIFTKDGKGKTVATYSKCKNKTKENDTCPTCKIQQSLDMNFTDNVAELKNALNLIENCTPEIKDEKSKEELAKEEHKDDFKRLAKECDKKSKTDRLECNIDGLTKLLKDEKITYEQNDVTSFFDKYIKEPLRIELGSSNMTNWTTGGYSDFTEKLRDLTEKIKTMQDEVRGEYSYIRDRIGNVSIRAIADKALEINSYSRSNSPDALIAQQISMGQLQMMTQLLPAGNKAGLLAAVSRGDVSSLYAGNLYNSVDNYGNLILNNLSDISRMSPHSASNMLSLGLMGLDNWNYRHGAINSLELGHDRFNRISLASGLYDDGFFGNSRLNSFDSSYRRGFFGRDYSRPFGDRSGLRQSRRGTGRSGIFSDGRSGIFTDSFNRGFNDNGLGLLGSRNSFDSFNRSFDGGLNIRRDGSRLIQRGSNLNF